jgi:hypothetical protein
MDNVHLKCESYNLCRISCSHGGEYEDDNVLRDGVRAVCTLKTSVFLNETTRSYIPESCHPYNCGF